MDQVKEILRQCVKYRFWIAFGISLILPMVGFLVFAGAISQATVVRQKEIKDAKAEISKYTARGIVNNQYSPIVAQKKEVLTKDVYLAWSKLHALQAKLLRWPEDVEARFVKWGRKYPNDVDRGQVQATLIEYTLAYPAFVTQVYNTLKPFNYDDGTGIIDAPDEKTLIRPATFLADSPPDLGKVWAEQERLWVLTALFDAIAKINSNGGATNWETSTVKRLNLVEVGSPMDLDQKSLATNVALVPAEPLLPEGQTAPPPASSPSQPGPMGGMMGSGSSGTASEEVFYFKTEGQQFKSLPIKMNVLVEQSKLPEFLVGLENSPMAIKIEEIEISKPLAPVVKPIQGDKSQSSMGGYASMGGSGEMGGSKGMPPRGPSGPRGPMGGKSGAMGEMSMGPAGIGKGSGGSASSKSGTDARNVNKASQRKLDKEKDASKTKAEAKFKADQYYNVIEVTIYGSARFYLAPPAPATSQPSSSGVVPETPPAPVQATAPASAPPKVEEPKPAEAVTKDEPAKKAAPTQPEAAKPTNPTPPPPGEAPAAKPEEPKVEPAKPEPPKTEPPAPKR